jgi:SAM-dependent methyltransferase
LEAVELFCRWLAAEFFDRTARAMDCSYLALKYQGKLFSGGQLRPVMVAGYAARLAPVISALRAKGRPRILDAGSGCGSEAILFGLLGADVTGVDVVSFRTEYARSRLPFYRDLGAGELKVRFVNENVLKFLGSSDCYDIIWANEAISHIHPAEAFLQRSLASLKPGGFLVISDSNGLNPLARYRASRIRGASGWYVHRQFRLMDLAAHDEVAEERLFSVTALKRKLEQAGFVVQRTDMHGFLGSSLLPMRWHSSPRLAAPLVLFQKIMKKLPLLCLLGSGMTITASPGSTSLECPLSIE